MKDVVIYTDGACSNNPGPVGYGTVVIYKGHRKELSGGEKNTTNNRMELTAVIMGLKVLKEPCNVELWSDSKYVVDAIEKSWLDKWKRNNWMRNAKSKILNPDLWKELDKLLSVHNVKFRWVKGHNGNRENERCDQLAREYITRL